MESSDDDQLLAIKGFRKSLDAETDRGCALMAAAYLDSELEQVIRLLLVDDKKVASDLLGQGKPIGTFSSRIDLSLMLGLIGPLSHRDLHLIRRIRNDFGHTHHPLAFDDQSIANRCGELTHHLREETDPPRKLFISSAVGLLAIIHSAMKQRDRIRARQNPDLDRAKFEANQMVAAIRDAGKRST